VVSIDKETGKVVGVMINEDWTTPRPAPYRTQLSSDWWPVRSLFADLHERFVEATPYVIHRGEMIRCMYFTCVHPSARGQGVMKGLWKSTIDVAREHGYKSVTAQASSENVRQVLQVSGETKRGSGEAGRCGAGRGCGGVVASLGEAI
jgi:GNAT superfamily N-acetyltransferase